MIFSIVNYNNIVFYSSCTSIYYQILYFLIALDVIL